MDTPSGSRSEAPLLPLVFVGVGTGHLWGQTRLTLPWCRSRDPCPQGRWSLFTGRVPPESSVDSQGSWAGSDTPYRVRRTCGQRLYIIIIINYTVFLVTLSSESWVSKILRGSSGFLSTALGVVRIPPSQSLRYQSPGSSSRVTSVTTTFLDLGG